jgi:hypothetical protein
MKRTQIHLTVEQRTALKRIAKAQSTKDKPVSVAEVVRIAVDAYLAKQE